MLQPGAPLEDTLFQNLCALKSTGAKMRGFKLREVDGKGAWEYKGYLFVEGEPGMRPGRGGKPISLQRFTESFFEGGSKASLLASIKWVGKKHPIETSDPNFLKILEMSVLAVFPKWTLEEYLRSMGKLRGRRTKLSQIKFIQTKPNLPWLGEKTLKRWGEIRNIGPDP